MRERVDKKSEDREERRGKEGRKEGHNLQRAKLCNARASKQRLNERLKLGEAEIANKQVKVQRI